MTIYFFAANDKVKIGYTNRASHERKKQWQTGCPYPLTLLGEIYGASQAEERRLHFCFKKYKAKNAGREWFFLSEEIEEFIDKFATIREDESPDEEEDVYETDNDEGEPSEPCLNHGSLPKVESYPSYLRNFVLDMFEFWIDESVSIKDITTAWRFYANEVTESRPISDKDFIRDFRDIMGYLARERPSFKVREEEAKWVGIKIRDEAPPNHPSVEKVLTKLRDCRTDEGNLIKQTL